MAWVVDTNLVIDVAVNDPAFGSRSSTCLQTHRPDGLVIAPITYAELAPVFAGTRSAQEAFLASLSIAWQSVLTWNDVQEAWAACHRCVAAKRSGRGRMPPRRVADMFVGAFALRQQGLLTRNPGDFLPHFPRLPIHVP